MISVIKRITSSVRHALRGIQYAYQNDKSFQMELWGGGIFIGIGVILWPITDIEFFFLALSYLLILITELSNTALEVAFKRLHPDHHELVGASKDVASSAVLIAFIFAGTVVTVLFFSRIFA